MPVAVLHDNEEMLKEKTIEAAVKAVREDGAHAVIFGCTCMCTVQDAVTEGLKKQGIDIPVIEPYRAAGLLFVMALLFVPILNTAFFTFVFDIYQLLGGDPLLSLFGSHLTRFWVR